MDHCNEPCTQDVTGTCAVCEALAERDRFLRFWFQEGLFVDGVHAMQRRRVFALLHRYALPLALLFLVGLMLWLAWFIPRSIAWHSTLLRFMHENPIFVVTLIISLVVPLFWLLLWNLPQWQVAAVPEMKDRIDLESKSRQTLAQILGGAALLVGLYFTSQTLRTPRSRGMGLFDVFTHCRLLHTKCGRDQVPHRPSGERRSPHRPDAAPYSPSVRTPPRPGQTRPTPPLPSGRLCPLYCLAAAGRG
jgi:hypothetical protein